MLPTFYNNPIGRALSATRAPQVPLNQVPLGVGKSEIGRKSLIVKAPAIGHGQQKWHFYWGGYFSSNTIYFADQWGIWLNQMLDMLSFSWRSAHCEFSQVGMLLLSTTSHPLFLVILSFTTLPTVNSCHLLAKHSHFRHLISREKTLNGSNLEIFFSGIQIISLDIFVSIFCLAIFLFFAQLSCFLSRVPSNIGFSPLTSALAQYPQIIFSTPISLPFSFFSDQLYILPVKSSPDVRNVLSGRGGLNKLASSKLR